MTYFDRLKAFNADLERMQTSLRRRACPAALKELVNATYSLARARADWRLLNPTGDYPPLLTTKSLRDMEGRFLSTCSCSRQELADFAFAGSEPPPAKSGGFIDAWRRVRKDVPHRPTRVYKGEKGRKREKRWKKEDY